MHISAFLRNLKVHTEMYRMQLAHKIICAGCRSDIIRQKIISHARINVNRKDVKVCQVHVYALYAFFFYKRIVSLGKIIITTRSR